MSENQQVWENHYQQSRSAQSFPDENVVRYLSRLYRDKAWKGSFRSLDCGTGSGRNYAFLKKFPGEHFACDFAYNIMEGKENHCQASIVNLPFQENSFELVLCWGVLHYLKPEMTEEAIESLYRVIKPGGRLFCTVRSDQDTHLMKTLSDGDLAGGYARLFTKQAALSLFRRFSNRNYGFIMRQPLRQDEYIAHHMIEAQK
jgi:ubiquinone/menaquinone biosynthesis C-methylase UbiE